MSSNRAERIAELRTEIFRLEQEEREASLIDGSIKVSDLVECLSRLPPETPINFWTHNYVSQVAKLESLKFCYSHLKRRLYVIVHQDHERDLHDGIERLLGESL